MEDQAGKTVREQVGVITEDTADQDRADLRLAFLEYTRIFAGGTLKARVGNPPPRVTETPGGMLNSIGLQNPGVDAVLEKYAPLWAGWRVPVIVNVAGESVSDYVEVAKRLDGVPGVAGIELNISCPNVGKGGLQFAIDAGAAAEVTAAVRRATDLPLLVKLSPNVADVRPIAKAIAAAGADALTAINTLSGIAVRGDRARPLLGNIYGGLSGPAVKPVALRVVYEAAQVVEIPVVAARSMLAGWVDDVRTRDAALRDASGEALDAAMAVSAAVACATALVLLVALRPLAVALGFVDRPNCGRKAHVGEVPLHGGLAIFSGLVVAVYGDPALGAHGHALIAVSAFMVMLGMADDRFDLRPRVRLIAHLAAALVLVLGMHYRVQDLGDLLGIGVLWLGPLSLPFTVVACVALVNAFMADFHGFSAVPGFESKGFPPRPRASTW